MPKQRMSTTDVAAEVACLRSRCLGMRVANIYDLNSRTYLFKLARSGEAGEKVFLLMESGTRFHTTQTLKERPDAPSNFALKLRKHVRTRRLEDVRQLGVDRIVDFTFGTGDATYHIILELYSQGNVILTDGRYEVLTLLRSHRDDDRGLATMPRHPYPLHSIRLAAPVTAGGWAGALAAATDEKATLRSVLARVLLYGPHAADHCLLTAGLQPTQKAADARLSEDQTTRLLATVQAYEAWLAGCAESPPAGYIILSKLGDSRKKRAAAAEAAAAAGEAAAAPRPPPDANEEGLVYDEFEALPLAQHAARPHRKFDTFDAALDEFFSKVEGQRAEVQVQAATKQVLSKLEKTRIDQAARAEALGREADAEEDQAALIEYNMAAVDAAIDALNAALGRGLDWRELAALIEAEKRAGNPVASTVGTLHLERNAATLLLRNLLDEEEDSDEESAPPAAPQKVEVDLGMNAAANARVRHEARKRAAAKQRKTLAANEKALAAAEKRTTVQLAQVQAKAVQTRELRQAAWFERFAWFVSSENYLVLSARDAPQADLLVKRHMRQGDVFVHAELQGAPVTIVKNADPSRPVPPLTISQAGAACVCRSAAWDAKIVTSACWVGPDQVSKIAPTGEELSAGSFHIRGRKNFLPPTPLIMGLAFLFVLDDDSAASHAGERAVKSADTAAATSSGAVADAPDGQPGETDDGAEEDVSAGSGLNSEPEMHEAAAAVEAAPIGSAGGGAVSGSAAGGNGEAGQQQSGSSALYEFMDSAADPRASSFQRYGLEEAQPSSSVGADAPGAAADGTPADAAGDEADGDTAGEQQQGGGRRHVPAAQRRAARKQGLAPGAALPAAETTTTAEPAAADDGDAQVAQQQPAAAADDASVADGGGGDAERDAVEAAVAAERARVAAKLQSQAPAAARGKAAKLKKVKDKYADQDDEDRRLAMEALASAGGRKDKGDKKQARKARRDARRPEAAAPAPLPTREEMAAVNARPVDTRRTWGRQAAAAAAAAAAPPLDAAAPADSGAGAAPDAGAAAAAAAADAPRAGGAEAAAARPDTVRRTAATHEEDGDPRDDVADAAAAPAADLGRLELLDAMTGVPRDDDGILHALPVCAPYQVLANYRYKVKLTPGGQKRGKAARQATELVTRGAAVPASHADAIRRVAEADAIAACLGGVKLSVPGLQAAKAAAKKGRKAKGK